MPLVTVRVLDPGDGRGNWDMSWVGAWLPCSSIRADMCDGYWWTGDCNDGSRFWWEGTPLVIGRSMLGRYSVAPESFGPGGKGAGIEDWIW